MCVCVRSAVGGEAQSIPTILHTLLMCVFARRCRFTKPQSFADCVGDELPVGWEESYDQIIGRYYINHFIRM